MFRRTFLAAVLVLVLGVHAKAQTTFPSTSVLHARVQAANTMAKYDALTLAGRQPALLDFVLYPSGFAQMKTTTGVVLRTATYTIVSPTQIDVVLAPNQGQLTPVIYRFWLTSNTTNNWYGFALFGGVPSYAMRANF